MLDDDSLLPFETGMTGESTRGCYSKEQDSEEEVRRSRRVERAAEKAKTRERDRWKSRVFATGGD